MSLECPYDVRNLETLKMEKRTGYFFVNTKFNKRWSSIHHWYSFSTGDTRALPLVSQKFGISLVTLELLDKLHQNSTETAPSLRTLKSWSKAFNWQKRSIKKLCQEYPKDMPKLITFKSWLKEFNWQKRSLKKLFNENNKIIEIFKKKGEHIMKKSISTISLVIVIILFIGCAATYQPPTISPQSIMENIQSSKVDIFNAAKQILIMEGYQILSSDESSGTISTSHKRMNLDETQCDCGTTMGLPYIKDNRTFTTVSLGILISENKINIKATIEGEYLKGDAVQGVNLVCVSTGKIERELMEKIKSQLSILED